MALRSLGTSLLAKNKPGTAFREQKEKKMSRPPIPGKGEIGTLRRSLVQEPMERRVPAGSVKVTTARPTIDEISVPGEAPAQAPNLIAGAGVPVSAPAQAGGAFTAGISPNTTPRVASQAAPGGRTATSVSGGAAPGAAPASGQGQIEGGQTRVQVPQQAGSWLEGVLPSMGSTFSGRVIADDPNAVSAPQTNPNTGQAISSLLGNVIDTVGQKFGNPFAEKGISERLQSFGSDVGKTTQGVGSPTFGIRNILSYLDRGAQPIRNRLRSKAQEIKRFGSVFRSLFNR